MVRRRYAEAAIERAVVTGATRHGDGFALTVEQADEPVLTEHADANVAAATAPEPPTES